VIMIFFSAMIEIPTANKRFATESRKFPWGRGK
jgi:hypothetical protein